MNIFILHQDPKKAARALQDLHVGKMLLEACQLLCSAHPPGAAPYRPTHLGHPCSLWTRASLENYRWLVAHAQALGEEYLYRFGKSHASFDVAAWCRENEPGLPSLGLLPFAQAMPDCHRGPDAVAAYRAYYAAEKRLLRGKPAQWTRRRVPRWFVQSLQLVANGLAAGEVVADRRDSGDESA